MQPNWNDYKADFEWDGSLRDIYVLDTSLSHWQALLDLLHSGTYKFSTYAYGEEAPAPLPPSATNLFNRGIGHLLCINLGPLVLNCHFFTEQEIEFDLDPREVKSQAEAEHLFAFMIHLGNLMNKEVVLTPENGQDSPIFRFLPSVGELQYIPCNLGPT